MGMYDVSISMTTPFGRVCTEGGTLDEAVKNFKKEHEKVMVMAVAQIERTRRVL